MKKTKQCFYMLFMSLSALPSQAQNTATIKGSITDEQQKPLATATVTLLDAKDSSVARWLWRIVFGDSFLSVSRRSLMF